MSPTGDILRPCRGTEKTHSGGPGRPFTTSVIPRISTNYLVTGPPRGSKRGALAHRTAYTHRKRVSPKGDSRQLGCRILDKIT